MFLADTLANFVQSGRGLFLVCLHLIGKTISHCSCEHLSIDLQLFVTQDGEKQSSQLHEHSDQLLIGVVDPDLQPVHQVAHTVYGDSPKVLVYQVDHAFATVSTILPIGAVIHFGQQPLNLLCDIDLWLVPQQIYRLFLLLACLAHHLYFRLFLLLTQHPCLFELGLQA